MIRRPPRSTLFPTRRSSDLDLHNMTGVVALPFHFFFAFTGLVIFAGIYFPITHTQLEPLHELHEKMEAEETGDRKSTRLNSSHLVISYAVFCLKKQNPAAAAARLRRPAAWLPVLRRGVRIAAVPGPGVGIAPCHIATTLPHTRCIRRHRSPPHA